MSNIEKTRDYIKKAFEEKPHYSFDDWTIMYNHSLKVAELSEKIAEAMKCDKEILIIGGLLHDIGKTYEADEETLKERHAELAWVVCEDFVNSLNLKDYQSELLKNFFTGNVNSIEAEIIEDADIISFYADKKLYEAYRVWALNRNAKKDMQRKLDKIKKLKFDKSKEIVQDFYKNIVNDWEKYL